MTVVLCLQEQLLGVDRAAEDASDDDAATHGLSELIEMPHTAGGLNRAAILAEVS